MVNVERAAKIAANIKLLQGEVAEREEAIENYKSALAEELGIGADETVGNPETGFFSIKTFVGGAYNEAFLKKEHPELWAKAAEHVEAKKIITSAVAKAHLSPEDYKLAQKPHSKTTVLVELLGDE